MKICYHAFIKLIIANILIFPLVLSANNYTLAPLGSPRILLSDNSTLSRLQTLMQTNAVSATRFKEIVDNQISGVDDYWYFQYWHAALLGKVLNQAHYCGYAVQKTDEFIKYGNTIWEKVKDLPRGYCHGDMYNGNIYKTPDKKLYILDFDTSCNGFPMYDLALICNKTHYFNFDESGYFRSKEPEYP